MALGGLGICSPADHASAAHISSVIQSSDLIREILRNEEATPNTANALDHFNIALGEEATFTMDHLKSDSQKSLSYRVDSKLKENILLHIECDRGKARLNSRGLPHTGDWLNAIPSPILGLYFKPSEFRLAVLYCLGAPVFTLEGKCPAYPNRSDVFGDHAISCRYQGERIARHNQLRDKLFHTAICAQLAPSREERALLPGIDQRPADIFIPHWSSGKDTAYDVTIINPLQLELAVRSAKVQGHSLTVAYKREWEMYGDACFQEGIDFVPLPVETMGGWSEGASGHIQRLGQALARALGREESETVNHLFQRLSKLLMKGNMALLLNRVPGELSSEMLGSQQG